MAADNIFYATNSMRSSVSSLKKKLSNLKVQIEQFDAEIQKVESKFDNIITQAEIYKSKVEREMGREVRRLERELALLAKDPKPATESETNAIDLKVASSVAIFETILRHMCGNADDFRLASQAFLFPAVYERLIKGEEEAYYLEEVPDSAHLIITRGQEYIAWLRSEYDTHLTNPQTWSDSIDYIAEWWRNDALPLLYGARDEQWDIDVPMSLAEMLAWQDSPGDRPLMYSSIFDVYEVYKKNKELIYEPSGLREFEFKHFSFSE
jgi:chromosome segregation ATPase